MGHTTFDERIAARRSRQRRERSRLEEGSGSCEEATCVICMQSLSDSDSAALPCAHVFHAECVREWGRVSALDRNAQCPMCRVPFHAATLGAACTLPPPGDEADFFHSWRHRRHWRRLHRVVGLDEDSDDDSGGGATVTDFFRGDVASRRRHPRAVAFGEGNDEDEDYDEENREDTWDYPDTPEPARHRRASFDSDLSGVSDVSSVYDAGGTFDDADAAQSRPITFVDPLLLEFVAPSDVVFTRHPCGNFIAGRAGELRSQVLA